MSGELVPRVLANQVIRDMLRVLHEAEVAGTPECKFTEVRNRVRAMPAFRVAKAKWAGADKLLGHTFTVLRRAGWVKTHAGLALSLTQEGMKNVNEIWSSFVKVAEDLSDEFYVWDEAKV